MLNIVLLCNHANLKSILKDFLNPKKWMNSEGNYGLRMEACLNT
jgi:hypothetical protein